MQIQRVIEESMGVVEEAKNLRNSSSGKIEDGTTISGASVSSPDEKKSSRGDSALPREPEVVSANRSFLHGQDSRKVGGNFNNDGPPSERVVYATLDSLALKRARLPLQLVPIDDETEAACEKKEKVVCEKRTNTSRKTSPKRPSFKVRPGVSITGQWKSRPRSTPRLQSPGKSDNVSKDLASRLIIFENIIRSNNSACEIARESPAKIVPEQETKSGFDNSNFPRKSFEKRKSPKISKTEAQDRHDNLAKVIDTNSEPPVTKKVSKIIEPNGVRAIEVRDVDSSVNIDFDYRSVEGVSKNIDPISGTDRSISQGEDRTDSSINIDSDDRSQEKVSEYIEPIDALGKSILSEDCEKNACTANISNNIVKRLGENQTQKIEARNGSEKSFPSAEYRSKNSEIIELRYIEVASIAKNLSAEIPPVSRTADLSKKNRRKPEFAFAKNVLNARRSKNPNKSAKSRQHSFEPEVSNLESSRSQGKSFSREELRSVSISLPTNFVHLASATNPKLLQDGENSSGSSRVIQHEEKFAELEYLGEIEIGSKVCSTTRKSVRNPSIGSSEYAGFDFAESASPSSSSLGDNGVESRDVEKRAKVSSLENSQGVPEVVKRSENEGSVDDDGRAARWRIAEDTRAPVYESMSEFSTSGSAPAGSSARANESFLWGGRAALGSARFRQKSRVDDEQIGQTRFESREREIETGDFSIGEDNYDAYDDVGLSRENAEEDLYDDVGPPSEAANNNSSSDTIFEEIDETADSELYDDVSPGPNAADGPTSFNGLISVRKDPDPSSEKFEKCDVQTPRDNPSNLVPESLEFPENHENPYLSISNDYSSVEEGLNDFEAGQDDDTLYDDVELPSQDRVNSLYAGSSSGSQLGSLYNGKESEWEDLEEPAPVLPLPKKNNVVMRNSDSQGSPSKKKTVHRWSRKVRRQKSKASRKNPASRSASRTASAKGTSTFFVAVSLGTGSVLLVGSSTTTDNADNHRGSSDDSRAPPSLADPRQRGSADGAGKHGDDPAGLENTRLQTRGLVQLRILGGAEDSLDTQETSCYVLEDTASDDSNYETLCSFPSDEFSSGSDDDDCSTNRSSLNGVSGLQGPGRRDKSGAPSRPVPPPPRESSLTETFGKRMKMLRRTWSITKGSLGRMRRRASTTVEPEASADEAVKYPSGDQSSPNNDGRKYFSFKKHFRKSLTGLSTFYLDNENNDERLSRNNNRSKEEIYSNGSNSSWYTNTEYRKNGVSEQSQRNDIDHYSMLDEEPLYQFYAAAAARVAFESDSEGYEEVEDPTPAPSAADLAKPGHRTLWCQTPQVINSDLLQRLTPDEKKVQEAKFEIFTSEASYLNSLRVLVDEFLNNHELVYEVLTPSEREKLFGGVPSVLIASERLLAELETVWREDVMLRGLPEVLLNYAQRSSSVYIAYCSNQVSIDTTLKELRSKKGSKFVETVTRIESHPACQSLSLHSFLMLPMQRVTRLPLLADAVLSKLSSDSKEERTCWECVLSQLSQVVMECNEGARAAGRLAEMEALERKLEYSSKVPPIVLRDRYLVRRGPVVQMLAKADAEYKLTFGKKYHKASLYLLLLTDYLLIAKPKSNANEETYTVIDTCKRSLVALEKVPEDSPFAGRHAMVLSLLENYSSRHVEYILTCNNATERERWLDAVSPPKPSLVGETLYETWDCPQVMALYPYAAAQPDELTLQPGDVINVLRKMTDGWHLGEKLLGGEQGWFPGNYAKEVASEHVRARNLRQRHRLLR